MDDNNDSSDLSKWYRLLGEDMEEAQFVEAVHFFRRDCLKELATFCMDNGIPFVFNDVDDGTLAVPGIDMTWLPKTLTPYQHVQNLLGDKYRPVGDAGMTPMFTLWEDEGIVMVVQQPDGVITLEILNSQNPDI